MGDVLSFKIHRDSRGLAGSGLPKKQAYASFAAAGAHRAGTSAQHRYRKAHQKSARFHIPSKDKGQSSLFETRLGFKKARL